MLSVSRVVSARVRIGPMIEMPPKETYCVVSKPHAMKRELRWIRLQCITISLS